MKRIVKLIIINVIFIGTIGSCQLAYESDRLIDIPVPPNSSGYADFTSEEAEQKAKEYEQNKEKNQEANQEEIQKIGQDSAESKKEERKSKEVGASIVIIAGVIIVIGTGVGIYKNKVSKLKGKK